MEAFLEELQRGGDAGALCAALPPAWSPRDVERARAAIDRLPPQAAEFARSLVPFSCGEEDNDSAAEDHPEDCIHQETLLSTGDDVRSCLDDDRRAAEGAARAHVALVLEKEHLCHAAERFFAKSDRGSAIGEERCEVWAACAAVADVLGMRSAQGLAGNGTEYKPDIQDAEDLARMLSEHGAELTKLGVRADGVPIRVAREGCWASQRERAEGLRKARMRIIRYITETDAIVEAVRRTLEEAETDPAGACARLDRRKRGRGGKIKLGTGNVVDVDWAYASTVCPGTCALSPQ